MIQLEGLDLAESLARLHVALDQREMAPVCGEIIEQLLGAVPWQVGLGDSSGSGTQACFGGVGRSVDTAPKEHSGARVELCFRDETIGELLIGCERVPEGTAWSVFEAHLGAALSKLQLWIQAEDEALERRLGHEMLGDMSALVGSFDVEYVLARSLEQVLKVVGSEVGSVMLWDGHRFATSVVLGLPEEVTRAIRLDGKPVAEAVAQVGEPLLLRDPDLSGVPQELARVDLSMLLLIPLTSGGRVVGVLSTANPSFDSSGSVKIEAAEEICRLAAVAVENAFLHRELLQQERMATIGQVMAGLSHDIKNMLQTMHGGYYLLQMGVDNADMECVGESYPILRSGMDRISDLVMSMLDYSKSRTPAREPMDMNALGEEIVTASGVTAAERDVTVTLQADEDMKEIPADSASIFRCLSNLVTNAVEAVEEGGHVEVRTRWSEGRPMAEVSVTDDGPGIPEEDRERIFDALFTTKGSKGTGLGLATTKKIVEEHGGQVLLESEPGRGTTFTILLPKEA